MTAGRPTKYKAEYAEQAEKLCKLGAIDTELADFFETTERTINAWKQRQPKFLQALKDGKTIADADVADSLHGRATGYEWTEEQAIKIKVGPHEEKVEIVEVAREVPPDPTSMIFWLKNRRPKDWRDKREHEMTGKDGESLKTDDRELARWIALELRQADK